MGKCEEGECIEQRKLQARMQEAEEYSHLMRQIAMDNQSRWRLEADAARTAAESRVEGLEAMVQWERADKFAIQAIVQDAREEHFIALKSLHRKIRDREDDLALAQERFEATASESKAQSDVIELLQERVEATASELKAQSDVIELLEAERKATVQEAEEAERMQKAEEVLQRLGRLEAMVQLRRSESRVEGLEAIIQHAREENFIALESLHRKISDRDDELAFALERLKDTESDLKQERERLDLLQERFEATDAELKAQNDVTELLEAERKATVQNTRDLLEGAYKARVQSEESLREEILDREDAYVLLHERKEVLASEVNAQRGALELLEEERISRDGVCCICQASPATCVMVPCGHWCICDTCGKRAHQGFREERTCPLCRKQVDQVVQIFRSASSSAKGSCAVPDGD